VLLKGYIDMLLYEKHIFETEEEKDRVLKDMADVIYMNTDEGLDDFEISDFCEEYIEDLTEELFGKNDKASLCEKITKLENELTEKEHLDKELGEFLDDMEKRIDEFNKQRNSKKYQIFDYHIETYDSEVVGNGYFYKFPATLLEIFFYNIRTEKEYRLWIEVKDEIFGIESINKEDLEDEENDAIEEELFNDIDKIHNDFNLQFKTEYQHFKYKDYVLHLIGRKVN
jgi:hypothetical protein